MSYSYGGATKFYRLPYMVSGNYLAADAEEARAKIIDSLLYVATYGATNAIVEDADYSISSDEDGNTILKIDRVGTSYVFAIVLNGRLAYREDPIELTLENGIKWYVYVGIPSDDSMDSDPTTCLVEAFEEEQLDSRHLLLCTVDCTGDEPVLDTDTDKVYLQSFTAHTMDSTNPHGTTLSQTTLRITSHLLIQGEEVYPAVYYDLDSPGTTGTVVNIEGMSPKFVTAMPGDPAVGCVACTINTDGTLAISNSGDAGLPIRLKIEGTLS